MDTQHKSPSDGSSVVSKESIIPLIVKWFVRSVAVILFITAAAKCFSVYKSGGSIITMDPLFTFIRTDVLLVLVALLETGCAVSLCLMKKQRLQLLLIIWLSTLFLFYRIGLLAVGYTGPCNCLGKPQSWLYFPFFKSLNTIMEWVLAYMLILSCVLFGLLRYHAAKWLKTGQLESPQNQSS
jgi:hypothetical protein